MKLQKLMLVNPISHQEILSDYISQQEDQQIYIVTL